MYGYEYVNVHILTHTYILESAFYVVSFLPHRFLFIQEYPITLHSVSLMFTSLDIL